MEYIAAIHGPYCIIAHTGEGEFVYGRYSSAAARDTAFSIYNAELNDDIDMVSSGSPYTLYYADELIKFSKRNDEVEEWMTT